MLFVVLVLRTHVRGTTIVYTLFHRLDVWASWLIQVGILQAIGVCWTDRSCGGKIKAVFLCWDEYVEGTGYVPVRWSAGFGVHIFCDGQVCWADGWEGWLWRTAYCLLRRENPLFKHMFFWLHVCSNCWLHGEPDWLIGYPIQADLVQIWECALLPRCKFGWIKLFCGITHFSSDVLCGCQMIASLLTFPFCLWFIPIHWLCYFNWTLHTIHETRLGYHDFESIGDAVSCPQFALSKSLRSFVPHLARTVVTCLIERVAVEPSSQGRVGLLGQWAAGWASDIAGRADGYLPSNHLHWKCGWYRGRRAHRNYCNSKSPHIRIRCAYSPSCLFLKTWVCGRYDTFKAETTLHFKMFLVFLCCGIEKGCPRSMDTKWVQVVNVLLRFYKSVHLWMCKGCVKMFVYHIRWDVLKACCGKGVTLCYIMLSSSWPGGCFVYPKQFLEVLRPWVCVFVLLDICMSWIWILNGQCGNLVLGIFMEPQMASTMDVFPNIACTHCICCVPMYACLCRGEDKCISLCMPVVDAGNWHVVFLLHIFCANSCKRSSMGHWTCAYCARGADDEGMHEDWLE